MAGVLSVNVTLGYASSSSGSPTVLQNLQSFPNISGSPEQVEVTVLKDTYRHYIPGIKSFDALDFGLLYDKSEYSALETASATDQYWTLTLPDGSKFQWQGRGTPGLVGKGINEALTYTLSISLSSDITFTPSET